MENKDLYLSQEPTDSRTDYGKGLEPKIDSRTDYGKGLEPKIDSRTDFGKGIYFFTCDGKKVPTMEEVIAYNDMYYENMKTKKNDDFSEASGMHR